MSKQYHWVVVYDEDWGAFMVDVETTMAKLSEEQGVVYNKDSGKWEFMEEGSELQLEYLRLEEILAYQLTRLDLTAGTGQDTTMKTYEGVTVEYTQTIPTSKQMPEFYVWQEGYESYATITYLDRVVEIERGGEMHLTIPNILNGQLSDEYADIIRYSDDLEAAGINDDIQLMQFIKTISNAGFEVYRMNPWWELFAHNDDMGEIYETFYEAVDAGIDHILDDKGWD